MKNQSKLVTVILIVALTPPLLAGSDDQKYNIKPVQFDEQPKTVLMVGTREKNVGFVSFKEGVAPGCIDQNLYFDASDSLGKTFLSTLSLVKISSTKVRVGYSLPSIDTDKCTLEMTALID